MPSICPRGGSISSAPATRWAAPRSGEIFSGGTQAPRTTRYGSNPARSSRGSTSLSTWLNRVRRAGASRRLAALPAVVLLLVLSGTARAQEAPAADPETWFEGRVVINGQVLPGARLFAYTTFQDLLDHRPFAASRVTDDDGAWRIDVPRGRYYLLAKKLAAGADDGPVRAGDYSAYHGSNPITAVPGKYTHVGFSMEKLDADVLYEESARTDTGSLSGIVTSGGEPLEGAFVSLYPD